MFSSSVGTSTISLVYDVNPNSIIILFCFLLSSPTFINLIVEERRLKPKLVYLPKIVLPMTLPPFLH